MYGNSIITIKHGSFTLLLTHWSVDVDTGRWHIGSPSLLIEETPSLCQDRGTRLARLTGSVLVVSNDPELVAGSRLQSSDGEVAARLLNDGLPTRKARLEHL